MYSGAFGFVYGKSASFAVIFPDFVSVRNLPLRLNRIRTLKVWFCLVLLVGPWLNVVRICW